MQELLCMELGLGHGLHKTAEKQTKERYGEMKMRAT